MARIKTQQEKYAHLAPEVYKRKLPNMSYRDVVRQLIDDGKIARTINENSIKHIASIFKKMHIKYVQKLGVPEDVNQEKPLELAKVIDEAFSKDDISEVIDAFDAVPDGESEAYANVQIKGPCVIGIINDVHVPYHIKDLVKVAFVEFKKANVDVIVMNGDIMDCGAVSHWDRRPNKRLLKEEVEIGRKFMDATRKIFPTQTIYYNEGNHEDRLKRYISQNAPELYHLVDFQGLFNLADNGIRWLDSAQLLKAGHLNIIHGHELKGSGINVAAAKYRKAQDNIIFGHHHVTQEYIKKDLNGKIRGSWAVGCLCDLKPDYTGIINEWNNGFAIVYVEQDGSFSVENKKMYFDGYKFNVI